MRNRKRIKKLSHQHGIATIALVVIGIVILLLTVFLVSGALKFRFSVSRNRQPTPSISVNQESIEPEPKTYENEQAGISFTYPNNWRVVENPEGNIIVAVYSPKEGSNDQFTENVNVDSIDISAKPDLTLTQVADLWLQQNERDFPSGSFTLVDRSKTTLARMPAEKIVYLLNYQGLSGKGMAVITLKDTSGYTITYSAQKASYDKFLPDVESILNSFTTK